MRYNYQELIDWCSYSLDTNAHMHDELTLEYKSSKGIRIIRVQHAYANPTWKYCTLLCGTHDNMLSEIRFFFEDEDDLVKFKLVWL